MSKSTVPPGFSVVATSSLYSGVGYARFAKPTTPVVAHVARIAPGAPVDLRVVNANDKISTSPRELEPTSSICGRVHCIVGVNGDFHRSGTPAGAVVADGRMLRSPHPARPQLVVTGDGRLTAGPLPWTGSFTAADGTQLPLSAINVSPAGDGLTLFTPAYGPRTEAPGRVELVIGGGDAIGTVNRSTGIELRGLRSGAGPIPPDGAVLSGEGVAAQQLRDLWTKAQAPAQRRGQLMVSSPIDAKFSLGVEPVVLRDGRRALPWRDPNVINPRQPHTLVGWNNTGETFLVAVDGRQTASEGMTMAEAADFLLALGATDAVNLDGGGGTTFAAGGSVWNRPSDDDPVRPTEYTERGTPNVFAVMARPGAPPAPASPPAPKPVTRPTTSSNPTQSGTGGEGDIWAWGDGSWGSLEPLETGGVEGGAHLAEGELPVGPLRGARAAAGSGAVGLAAAPGTTAPAELPAASAPSSGPEDAPAAAGAKGRGTAGSPDEGLEAPAAVMTRHLGSGAGRAGATAIAAALLLATVAVGGRRRLRRRSLSLLIEKRHPDALVAAPPAQGSTTRSSRWITSWGAPSGRSVVRDPANSVSSTEL
ncbi:MAG TPA: phosphodiester glycosidase family protein [Acidimicrobiia bacterium]|nr:phosphodiester glycosidase family protein [Acidimicrobiia bacterium]